MLGNTTDRWGSLAKALHWAIALLIAFEVPVGFLMAATYGAGFRDEEVKVIHVILAQVHYTIGFTVLLLVAVRLFWRRRNPVPTLPAQQSAYQRWLARGNHWAFYLLLVLVPLSGWSSGNRTSVSTVSPGSSSMIRSSSSGRALPSPNTSE